MYYEEVFARWVKPKQDDGVRRDMDFQEVACVQLRDPQGFIQSHGTVQWPVYRFDSRSS